MKVFSKKKMYSELPHTMAYLPGSRWADECDRKPVHEGKIDGYIICDNWCIEVPDAVEDVTKKEREDLWATLNSYDWKSFFEAEKKPFPEAVNCRCTVLKEAPPKHPRYKIVIECNDDFTTAKMYVDGRQVKGECAKRNPADKFSWRIGAQTAFNRLWEKKKKPVKPVDKYVQLFNEKLTEWAKEEAGRLFRRFDRLPTNEP